MNTNNIILLTDSYKQSHHKMYPDNTDIVYSYFESRNGAKYDTTIFFGLQYLIKKYLVGRVVTEEKIEEAKELINSHLGPNIFNEEMWLYILDRYDGYLPITIKAVPEGTEVPVNNVMMTVENTDPKCFPLTNHLETLLTHVWAPSTIATLSDRVYQLCNRFLDMTSDNKDGLNFMLHDFGARGVSSVESAGIGGAAHLLNFLGTDTLQAMVTAKEYYNAPLEGLAYSVPASEHSVMTSLGKEGESKMVDKLLNEYPNGILSIVSDSYDIYNFVENIIGDTFKDRIANRNGKVVIRPDSGDPVKTTFKVLEILGEKFGYTTNSKGYKVLPPCIGVIWGDGIDYNGINDILKYVAFNKWSAENLVFGMGGGLLQKINRDTQRFAFKCSAQKRNGEWVDIFKNPLDQSKASKKGRLRLQWLEGSHKKVMQTSPLTSFKQPDLLQTVFSNGKLENEISFEQCRKNVKK